MSISTFSTRHSMLDSLDFERDVFSHDIWGRGGPISSVGKLFRLWKISCQWVLITRREQRFVELQAFVSFFKNSWASQSESYKLSSLSSWPFFVEWNSENPLLTKISRLKSTSKLAPMKPHVTHMQIRLFMCRWNHNFDDSSHVKLMIHYVLFGSERDGI